MNDQANKLIDARARGREGERERDHMHNLLNLSSYFATIVIFDSQFIFHLLPSQLIYIT